MEISKIVFDKYKKTIEECNNEEIYFALLDLVKETANSKVSNKEKKKVYYISAEFLIGKLLSNNLINLGLYDEVKEELKKHGKNINCIEDMELEPSLGNGGLGRLAACFLDSIATLGLNGDGIGLNYHFGLFRQVFKNNLQMEEKNPWIDRKTWLRKTDISYKISFEDCDVVSRLYEIDVIGYESRVNKLRLFDIESINEEIVSENIDFDKTDIKSNLTLFLYPDDSDENGRLLRIYQQYFMVSNATKLIIEEAKSKGSNLHDLKDYAVIQINDTHPAMVIPELIRQLMEEGIDIEEAISIVTDTCAYTNHTILAEALEKWPIEFMEKTVPQLMPIIKVLSEKVDARFNNKAISIIDENNLVHMAHMAIHYGFSVNGVAALHTEILKNSELNEFYKIYPEKFNNKTNGITFRRWLLKCNPDLTTLLVDKIGEKFKKDALELGKLEEYKNNNKMLDDLLDIKRRNKVELANYLEKTQNIVIDPDSIFDIQIKRLHEYKRQQMNALYVIDKYLEIKQGIIPKRPITVIFGAKAAPAYVIAKDIIHLILCLQEIVNNDDEVNKYLKVVMVENYNVTLAEKLIPACDISEQISLASKEASGTSNMKFMLNGAITLGTLDGANIEIADLVGEENIYIFGKNSDEVIKKYEKADYNAKEYYESDEKLKIAIDFILSDKVMNVGNKENLTRLYKELINKDWFMALMDWREYKETKDKIIEDYENKDLWAKKMVSNISSAGFFSSDRTIEQYNDEIWKLEV